MTHPRNELPQKAPDGLPTKSAMLTALGYTRHQASELEKLVTTVSGSGEGAEIYRDAARCIAFALVAQEQNDKLRAALTAVLSLFNADCALSCSGEYQIEVVEKARAALATRSDGK
jgi:hypothetical protein